MKKFLFFFLTSAAILGGQRVTAQCTIEASASPYLLCVGDSTLLTASASIPGSYYTFDFNDTALPPGWTIIGGASFTTGPACAAPSLDNSPFYWSSTSTITPSISTSDLDVSAGGSINYEFRFKGNSSSSPCETADQYNEGVILEFSTNSGGSWATVVYHCSVPSGGPWAFIGGYPQTLTALPASTAPGNGNGSTGIYDNWAPYSIPIPPAAQTTSTRFRWRQPNSSGSCCDNWGLDNINVAANPTLYFDWSNGLSGYGSNSQWITNLPYDTCLLVFVTDTVTSQSCADTVCIQVQQIPNLVMQYSNPFCVGELVTFDGILSDSTITNFQYDLDYNSVYEVNTTSTTYAATGAFTTAGNYTISIQGITAGGCVKTIDTTVNVFNRADINLTAPPTVCIYDSVDFSAGAVMNNPPGQSSTIANYEWDFNFDSSIDLSGPAATNPSYFYPGLGTYTATVTVTSDMGCVNSDTIVVEIVDRPQGNIVVPQICANEFGNFNFNNTGDPLSTYFWDFGTTAGNDTSNVASPSFNYPGNGTYVITLTATTANGCVDVFTENVVIDPLPAGTINNYAVCQGHEETFDFNQTSPDTIVSYVWNLPTGVPNNSTDLAPTSLFEFAGTVNVSIILTNQYGCSDTMVQPFVVRAQPVADFDYYPICISRFTFDPMVVPDSGSVVLDWNMGDGTTFDNMDTSYFNYLYGVPGDFDVTLVITDQFGCQDSILTTVHVDDSLVVEMPNVLYRSSQVMNDRIDMEHKYPGFNWCIDYTYTVFDRWGIKVFEYSNNPLAPDLYCDVCFKGYTKNGEALTPGVYYYVIEGNFNVLDAGFLTVYE